MNPSLSPLPFKDQTLSRQANYIDGKSVQADRERPIVVKNAATSKAIGEVPQALGAVGDAPQAIEAAH